jgi:hypothetical protein
MISKLDKLKPWLIPGLIIAAGALLRVLSLWQSELDIDESWRALIVSGHHGSLLKAPIVPPMSILLPRVAIVVLGNTEAALRLPGFLFALGSLILIFLLTRRIAGRTAAVLALFFLAFQPEYIQFDSTFKQYPYEVFFVLALICGAERVMTRGRPRDRILFAAIAVAGMLFATPLVHVYPAVFCVLLWNEWKSSKRFPLYSFGVACAALAASITVYLVFLKVRDPGGLTAFWQEGFVSGQPVVSAFSHLAGLTFEIFRTHLYHPSGILGRTLYRPIAALFLALTLAGCIRYLKERKFRFAAYTISPLVILAAYSCVNLWPFGANRVNLFYFPILMIAAAAGASFLWERLRAVRGAGPAAAALLGAAFLIIYPPVRRARGFVYGRDQLRTPIKRLLACYLPGDVVLTRDTTHVIFIYYSRYYAPFRVYRQEISVFDVYHPWAGLLYRRRIPPAEIEAEIQKHFRTHDRVWVVFRWDLRARNEEAAVLRSARRFGRQRWAMQKGLNKVLLFLPRGDPGPAASGALPEPEDSKGALDIVPPDHGAETPDPADDEPGAEIK